ncbi:hypothetical protein BpHYR1_052675 [Brachionus plicatilis]|uniref:Uncharacterized protein n=1 Tax=Brachionus plicatilis TaxID=10195 RepID=A0A3M7QFD0_BRAPC|nr:hypothetical protein BpHYR1_052675 [Brachionus plicatilis]
MEDMDACDKNNANLFHFFSFFEYIFCVSSATASICPIFDLFLSLFYYAYIINQIPIDSLLYFI